MSMYFIKNILFILLIQMKLYWMWIECNNGDVMLQEYLVCNRSDPHISDCLKIVLENIRNQMETGVPDMDIPPLDPLSINEINLTENEKDFLFKFFNVKVKGLSDFIIEDLRADIDNLMVEVKFKAPLLNFEGEYQIRGTIFRVKLNATGIASLTFWNIPFIVNIEADLLKRSDMKTYLTVNKLNNTIQIPSKAYLKFSNIFNGDEKQEQILENFINDNWVSMFKMYKYIPEVGLTEIFKNITNNICRRKSFGELFIE
ncbi:protein takeout-like isoform X2 [Lycorma delicatula]|uniref:protein takeout-like isoform X2 n=1 Tax=Lycorma delicatula TaxID=130591 RepID=UPI003F511BD6